MTGKPPPEIPSLPHIWPCPVLASALPTIRELTARFCFLSRHAKSRARVLTSVGPRNAWEGRWAARSIACT
jgi:hypothetical protein